MEAIGKKAFLPKFKANKNSSLIIYNKSTKDDINKHKTIIITKNRIRNYETNLYCIYSHLINSIFINILFILPKKILLSTLSDNYITLKLGSIGYQQIISDEYNISRFYPDKVYINDDLHILKGKKVLINSLNDIVRIEWTNTNQKLNYMFTNLNNIISVNINNMLNNSLNNISYMFYNCHNLEYITFTGEDNNYEIVDASKMFYNCYKLKSVFFDYSIFVSDITKMFYNCYSLTSMDLSKINSMNEINISYSFYNCHNLISFNKTGSYLFTNDMRYMFYNCYNLISINLTSIIIGSSTNISYLFHNCQNLIDIQWNTGLGDLNYPSDMRYIYYNCSSITSISLPFSKANIGINMAKSFYNCINLANIDLVNISYYPNDIHEMFYNCLSLQSLNIENIINTDYVLDMSYLFYNCISLNILILNFSNILTISMEGMFLNCKSLKSLDLSNFYTQNVEIMWNMFKDCGAQTLNLQNFDTSKVTDMESMFEGCSNLISLSIDNFITIKVHYMNKMFKDCTSLTSLNFKNIDSSSVGTMHQMFYNCKNLEYLNLYNIEEHKITISEMFTNVANNFTFCIKEEENIPNIFEILFNLKETKRDCSEKCYGIERANITDKKLCCPFVRYKDHCYKKCPRKTQIKDKINICEDFTCPKDNEYFNYEQNNCTTDIKSFFINDTVLKTIDKCHEECLECKEKWTNISTKCTVCKTSKPYIYLGNCYKDCIPGFYQGNINRCKCYNIKCELCSEASLEYDLCETCNKGYYPKENDITNYKNWINCYKDPEYYFLDNDIYKSCFSSCSYCIKKGNYENHFCLSCNVNNSNGVLMDDSINPIYNCYPNCLYYYYFDENKTYQCTEGLECPSGYKLIYNNKHCVQSCRDTKKNKYEFRGVCYEFCPQESFNLSKTDYYCRISCPFEAPFEKVKEQICVSSCTIMEIYEKICITNYTGNKLNNEIQDKVMVNIQNDLIDTFDYHYVNENVSIILEEINNTYEISTTNKKIDHNQNKTSYILFNLCETALKKYYSIGENESFYILKVDSIVEGVLFPNVIYLLYYPLNGFKLEQLDMTICEGQGISLFVPATLTEDEYLYDQKNKYYNDICYTFTSADGTDVSLEDRKKEYMDNNRYLCEEGCEFVKFHYDIGRAECSCSIKTELQMISDIKIDKEVLNRFVDVERIINLDIMKCFYLLWDNQTIRKNSGFYIFIPNVIMFFICIIIFYKNEYKLFELNLEEITTAKRVLNYVKEQKKKQMEIYGDLNNLKSLKSKSKLSKRLTERKIQNKSVNIFPQIKNRRSIRNPRDIRKVDQKDFSLRKFLLETQNSEEKTKNNYFDIFVKYNLKLSPEKKKNLKKILEYNDKEINSLNYKDALKNDHRTFFEYYFSLLMEKHKIFIIFNDKDYNLRIIKIYSIFSKFSSCYAINALFFDDSTMHKIYEEKGKYNLISQLPQIIYSTIISSVLDVILTTLSFPSESIIEIKQEKDIKHIVKKKDSLITKLHLKFIIFFILSFILLILFWYYITCFCSVYKNTQYHLIKDTVFSFGTSIITPFAFSLIAPIIRIPSLKKDTKMRKYLYKFSKVIQLI